MTETKQEVSTIVYCRACGKEIIITDPDKVAGIHYCSYECYCDD